MAYEYEHTLRSYLIGHRNVRPNFDGFEILRSLDELQEVYRKAKILDSVKMFASENPVESINDDLYDAGYVQACNDILEKIRKNDKGDN